MARKIQHSSEKPPARPDTYDSGYEHSLNHYVALQELVEKADKETAAPAAAARSAAR